MSIRPAAAQFIAMDACAFLGLANVTKALYALNDAEKRTLTLSGGKGNPNRCIISESGLYKLVLRSDKPEALPFQEWVTRVVLPAIRKGGGYIRGEETLGQPGGMTEDEFLEKAVLVAQRKINRLTGERELAQRGCAGRQG